MHNPTKYNTILPAWKSEEGEDDEEKEGKDEEKEEKKNKEKKRRRRWRVEKPFFLSICSPSEPSHGDLFYSQSPSKASEHSRVMWSPARHLPPGP